VRVHLGGHLNYYDPERRAWLDVPAAEPLSLLALCTLLRVPPEEVGVAAVNGAAAPLEEACAGDSDTVEFFPPIGGGDRSSGTFEAL
jgi:sulfur carrier protein ThiS